MLALVSRAVLAATENESTLEAQLEQECARACRPRRDIVHRGGADAGKSLFSTTTNPFLTSAECPKICRALGRQHPTVNMERALFGHVLRCSMRSSITKVSLPVAACVAETPLAPSTIERYPRRPRFATYDRLPGPAVELEERAALGKWSSWSLAFLVLPLGPALWLVVGLGAALRHERRRRMVLAPPPGHLLVEGRIVEDGLAGEPAVAVSFELVEEHNNQGRTWYSEKSHQLSARPFTIETDGGRLVDIPADRRSVELHAEVKGDGCLRSSAVGPGDKVWVYGRQGQPDLPARTAGATADDEARPDRIHLDGTETPIMVSTVPIEGAFRRDRNHRLVWVASLLGLLALLELICFGSYLDLLRSGRSATGYVSHMWSRQDYASVRGAKPRRITIHGVTVEVEGRSSNFEVHRTGWEDASKGSPVTVLLTPRTMALGHEAYATVGKSITAIVIMFLGAFAPLVVGRSDSAWYSIARGWRPGDG